MVSVQDARRFPAEAGGSNVLAVPVGTEDRLRTVGPFAIVGSHQRPDREAGTLPVDADVRPHPHIGLTAISYMIDGHVTHRDSLGNRRELTPGSVAFTISGRGVVHSERMERMRLLGGSQHLFQLLLAHPDGLEEQDPAFLFVPPEQIVTERQDGVTVRWVLRPGVGIVGGPSFLDALLLADVSLEPGASWSPPNAEERGVFVWAGAARVGEAPVGRDQTAVFGEEALEIGAVEPTRLLAFGGPRVGPRYLWWNYLHSSLERIEEARAAWRAGQLKLPVGDTESFTPAPSDDGRPLRLINAP